MPTKDSKVKANAQKNMKASTQAQALLSMQRALEYSTPKELAKVFAATELRMGPWSARECENSGPCSQLQRRLQRVRRSVALTRAVKKASRASSAAQPPKPKTPSSSSSSSSSSSTNKPWNIDEGIWTPPQPTPPSPPPLSPLNKNDVDE